MLEILEKKGLKGSVLMVIQVSQIYDMESPVITFSVMCNCRGASPVSCLLLLSVRLLAAC